MKVITLFYLEGCPYCHRAFQYMQELCEENPAYAKIPVKRVEENEQRALANSYDYYYVPCYYIGTEKLAEGAIDKKGVEAVFKQAMQ